MAIEIKLAKYINRLTIRPDEHWIKEEILRKMLEQSKNLGKECNSCREFKKLDDFHKHKIGIMGRTNDCKLCANAKARERTAKRKAMGITGRDNEDRTMSNLESSFLLGIK